MPIQLSTTIQNGRLDQIESVTGTAALMTVRTGSAPANCAAANTGTVLATINLPSDWMSAASGGTKAKLGTWQDTSADAAGTPGHFRIHDTGGTTCHIQGTSGVGSGDLSFDAAISLGGTVTISTFTLTDGNA